MKKIWKNLRATFFSEGAMLFMSIIMTAFIVGFNVCGWTKNLSAGCAVTTFLLFLNGLHMDYWRRKDADTLNWLEVDRLKFKAYIEMFADFMNRGRMNSRPPSQDDPIH